MENIGIAQLCRRWPAIPAFREEARRDLLDAARRSGVDLSEDDWDLLRRAADFLVADADDVAGIEGGDASAGGGESTRRPRSRASIGA